LIFFEKIRYKNFLSTGNSWTEIDLASHANTLIVGDNGAGKSTMLDALCFVLFGKPFRNINKPQLVNSVNKKNLIVEVWFSIGSNKYFIRRGIKPGVFEIYCNDNIQNQDAATRDYQKFLENNILKLNFNSFTQIVILGSSTFVPFMQLTKWRRREIIEDLLDIQMFSVMNILLKEKLASNKENLNSIRNEIEILEEKIRIQRKYVDNLKSDQKGLKEDYEQKIKESKESIEKLEEKIDKKEEQIDSLNALLVKKDKFSEQLRQIEQYRSKFSTVIRKVDKEISFYGENTECPTCKQDIDENFILKISDSLSKKRAKTETALNKAEMRITTLEEKLESFRTISSKISELREKVSEYRSQKNSLERYIETVRSDMDKLNEKSVDIQAEKANIDLLKTDLSNKNSRKQEILDEKSVLTVCGEMLKDRGVKAQIIKQYIPVMNKLINKYLTSMDFFVEFEIDEEFNETIKSRHRDSFQYSSFSEGEKMRIDLALLLTWRAIAKMKNSTNTNLLILDEVFDASLDNAGCDDFLKLLYDIGKNTNVFVISHKGDVLQDKFKNVIKFSKVKNFSEMEA
jgi:DNA repair exonuclease SbcCD ATPase subunit